MITQKSYISRKTTSTKRVIIRP